jgi:hypothetical protein
VRRMRVKANSRNAATALGRLWGWTLLYVLTRPGRYAIGQVWLVRDASKFQEDSTTLLPEETNVGTWF